MLEHQKDEAAINACEGHAYSQKENYSSTCDKSYQKTRTQWSFMESFFFQTMLFIHYAAYKKHYDDINANLIREKIQLLSQVFEWFCCRLHVLVKEGTKDAVSWGSLIPLSSTSARYLAQDGSLWNHVRNSFYVKSTLPYHLSRLPLAPPVAKW